MNRHTIGGLALIVLGFCASVHAVVRNDGTAGNAGDFPCAIMITGPAGVCSGTVVGNGKFVITAKHCITSMDAADYNITTDGGSFAAAGMVAVHPTADLAIIPLGQMLADSYDLYCETDEMNMEVCFAGYGSSSATPGGGMDELPTGTKRAGYNVIDAVTPNLVAFIFDLNGGLGNSEATTFGGDSGMGYLKQVGTSFQLLAVHSGILPEPGLNVDGSVSVGVRVSSYKDWIMMNIPAPGTGALFGIALVVASLRRRG